MRRRAVLTVLTLAWTAGRGWAVDLGTLGPTYPIDEDDLLAAIGQRLRDKERSGELARMERETKTRVVDQVNHPEPVAGIGPVEVARTFYFDPTFTLDRNIVDDKGRLLFAAGTRKNPLDVVSMSKHLLFFDARDERQVRKAVELMRQYDGRVKPILIGGSFLELMKRWQRPVYYDQKGILVRRLGILHVPALVSQEGLRLRIDEVSL